MSEDPCCLMYRETYMQDHERDCPARLRRERDVTTVTLCSDNEAGTLAPMSDTYQPGGIISYSWGYDQTNIDFYRITKRTTSPTGRVMLTLLPLASVTTDGDGWTGHCVPGEPSGAPAIRRKLHVDAEGVEHGVAVMSYGWGRLWDGQPEAWSAYA